MVVAREVRGRDGDVDAARATAAASVPNFTCSSALAAAAIVAAAVEICNKLESSEISLTLRRLRFVIIVPVEGASTRGGVGGVGEGGRLSSSRNRRVKRSWE